MILVDQQGMQVVGAQRTGKLLSSYASKCIRTDVGYLLKSIQPKELIDTIQLIHAGGTSITQEITEQVVEEMKRQRMQLMERGEFTGFNPYRLTKREFDLLDQLFHGSRYKTISASMNLSEGMVRNSTQR